MPSKTRTHSQQSKNYHAQSSESNSEHNEGVEEFIVESILEKRKIGGRTEYLIKWKDYSADENTWEPVENLRHAKDLLKSFEEKLKKKKRNKTEFVEVEKYSKDDEEEEEKLSISSKENEEFEEKPRKKVKKDVQPPSRTLISRKSANIADSESEEDYEKEEQLEKSGKGHFFLGDEPESILSCKSNKNNEIEFTVSWKKRKNKVTPKPNVFTAKELRRYNKDLLLDFYESKLKFVQSKNK